MAVPLLVNRLSESACRREETGREKGHLTIHTDGGSSMISSEVELMLSDLGLNKNHNKPHVSNDNTY